MKGKFLKKLVVMIMVTSFLAMTSATAFAQSANKGNNFSILENIPNAQAVQLSDAEMKDVKGELLPLLFLLPILYYVVAEYGEPLATQIANNMVTIHLADKASGKSDPEGLIATAKQLQTDFWKATTNVNIDNRIIFSLTQMIATYAY